MDCVEAAMTIEGAHDLCRHRRRRVAPDCGPPRPQALDLRLYVADGKINEGDFFDLHHG
jgi:hypothetical protein